MDADHPATGSILHAGSHDDEVVALAMIETRQGFENIAEIVATDGLDGIYVGPADLTLGLTGRQHLIGLDREEPEMIESIRDLLTTCHAAGKRAGLHCSTPQYAARAVEWGFDLVTVSNDVAALTRGVAADLQQARALFGKSYDRNRGAGAA